MKTVFLICAEKKYLTVWTLYKHGKCHVYITVMQNCTICDENTHNTIKCRKLKQGLDLDFVKLKGRSLEKQFAHDDALTHGQRKMKWRHSILLETLYAFAIKPKGYYHRIAFQNLKRMEDTQIQRIVDGKRIAAFGIYEPINLDWGECTQILTNLHGREFAVLNFANAFVPGGGYVEGCSAQEENIFRRTDLHFSLYRSQTNLSGSQYTQHMSTLINAEGLNPRVYMDFADNKHNVVIRGPESDGYTFLPRNEIFPFVELRAAAWDLRGVDNLRQSVFMEDCRRRIRAQLLTLKDNCVRCVVLGAFGCGAFQNPPSLVAEIYVEEISRMRSDFDVIAFAIIMSPDNLSAFQDKFSLFREPLLKLTDQIDLMND